MPIGASKPRNCLQRSAMVRRLFPQLTELGASLTELIFGNRPRSFTRTSIQTNWSQTYNGYASFCIALGAKPIKAGSYLSLTESCGLSTSMIRREESSHGQE